MITDEHKISEYYEALVRKDSQYNGIFYAGVNTTGIFCIASCRARKPRIENVSFLENVKEALRHGYRPCRVCRPDENTGTPPEEVRELLGMISASPQQKIADSDLRGMNISPSRIRRWFNENMGMTFQAYQRMIRLNTAYESLKKGRKVTDSAFDSGYDSISGFTHSFKNKLNSSPSRADGIRLILLERFPTPLGPMYAAATENALCLLEFTDRRMLETEFRDLSKRLQANIIPGSNAITEQTRQQVEEYFDGGRTKFDLPLETPGTPFQQKVWNQLNQIPYGETRSYLAQAQAMGEPAAVRAVARANGMNRIAIVVPCHRVLGSSGKLTGYAGGLARKRWLLKHEQKVSGIGQTHIF